MWPKEALLFPSSHAPLDRMGNWCPERWGTIPKHTQACLQTVGGPSGEPREWVCAWG